MLQFWNKMNSWLCKGKRELIIVLERHQIDGNTSSTRQMPPHYFSFTSQRPRHIVFLGNRYFEGNGTPLQYSCLENPMDGGAWWAAVHGGSLRVGPDRATSLSLFTFMHWRRNWQPTPVFLPGESQGWGSLVGCYLWGRTELDTTEAT